MSDVVLYTCPFVPAEWIAAHGLRPRRALPGVDGTRAAIPPRKGLCPYTRAFLNDVAAASPVAAVVATTTCDQMRRGVELLDERDDVPVFQMNVPVTCETAAAKDLYRRELQRLGKRLVRLGGSSPSPVRLGEVMRDFDARRAALRAARGILTPRGYHDAIAAFHRDGIVPDDGARTETSRDGVPLALVGGPLRRQDGGIFDQIEHAGGRVVLNATESGELTLPGPFDPDRLAADPLGEMVEVYFGRIPGVFRRPNDRLYAWLEEKLTERGARGIILRRYVWCDLWHGEAGRLRTWGRLPVLDLEVGDRGDAPARAEGRIEAFLEMLQ